MARRSFLRQLAGLPLIAAPSATAADARTRIIPGHGPIAGDHDLRRWREMLATIDERVKKLVAAGATLEQVKTGRPAKEWDQRFPGSFVTSDHVVEEAYRAVRSGE